MTFLLFFGGAVISIVLLLIVYARWNRGSLERQGFPVVPPSHWLLGGALESFARNGALDDIERMKKYGGFWGTYEGREPQIFVCDPELIRLITTKDSSYFDSKRQLEFHDPIFDEMMDFQPPEKWKIMRASLSAPINSVLKFKQSNPAMRETIRDYLGKLHSRIEGSYGVLKNFNLNQGIFSLLTDLIARSQFGTSFGSTSRLSELIQLLVTPSAAESAWKAYLGSYSSAFPFISRLLPSTLINPDVTAELVELLRKMMDMRRKSGESGGNKDMLDNLIEWCNTLKSSKDWQDKGINEMSVMSLGVTVFVGGQHQVSLILSTLCYYLTENPEKLSRLQEEVDMTWGEHNGILDHDAVNNMPYLNACITEATRLHPFFYRSERVCTQDWNDPTRGIQIKKGNVVLFPMWAANRHPDYYKDPEEFKPERFITGEKEKLHAYAFTSFGFGPRNCIGKRFAMEIMMLLMASLVRKFEFLRRENTKLKFIPGGPFFSASEPLYFDVRLRPHEIAI